MTFPKAKVNDLWRYVPTRRWHANQVGRHFVCLLPEHEHKNLEKKVYKLKFLNHSLRRAYKIIIKRTLKLLISCVLLQQEVLWQLYNLNETLCN